VKKGRLPVLGTLLLSAMISSLGANPAFAQAKSSLGKLAGVVRDAAGTPQMGASVEVVPEATGLARAFLTNTQGIFRGEKLSPGFYTVRVTLAGFLPTLEKHIRISSNLTTVVRVELESMFASLDQLRRQPSNTPDTDDWKWVLRSAPAMRPVLQWLDDSILSASRVNMESGKLRTPRALLELTDGARHPGSASSLRSAPATAFAYNQALGGTSRLILAGQMSYNEDGAAGGIATIWLPTGSLGAGPHTALVLRQAKLGPTGPLFRGVRIDQGGTLALGNRANIKYGSEFVLVGLGSSASSIRPRAELDVRITDDWHAALIFASMPTGDAPLETSDRGTLAAALSELDAFPALLRRGGRPVLQGGWHEEVAAERKLGARGSIQVAGFHDDNRHLALFGHGRGLPAADYFQGYFANGFAYDGGSSSSWGTRVAVHQKFDNDIELTALYAFGGALAPSGDADGSLREMLLTAPRHSLAAAVSAKVPGTSTKINAGYKWVSGVTLSRVDVFGESRFRTDPYLHLGVRQPLPKFPLGRWEAIADCDNVLAQGYVQLNSQDGHVVVVPAFRSFRGGLSVQF